MPHRERKRGDEIGVGRDRKKWAGGCWRGSVTFGVAPLWQQGGNAEWAVDVVPHRESIGARRLKLLWVQVVEVDHISRSHSPINKQTKLFLKWGVGTI